MTQRRSADRRIRFPVEIGAVRQALPALGARWPLLPGLVHMDELRRGLNCRGIYGKKTDALCLTLN